jgi:DoxX-like protein
MESIEQTAPTSNKPMIWVGRIVSALPVLLLVFSSSMKLLKPVQVVDEFTRLGYPENVIFGLGIVELACAVIYAIPQTAIFGAILLTGYLGGATATHLRAGDPTFNMIMPVILGVLIWGGVFLRDARLRKLLPLRS